MIYRTFGDLKSQVESELDTQDEDFCSDQEMQNYFNSAVTLCEATIVKLGLKEKYLQTSTVIDTVLGQSDYPLPSDIIINKIRKIVYRNSTDAYTLKPLTSEHAYAYEDQLQGASGEWYNYVLYKTGTQQVIRLLPTPSRSVPGGLRVIYFKSLNRYLNDAAICDLPDICYEYLLSYVRYRVYQKESHVNTPDEKVNMQALLGMMEQTMQNQIADPDMDLVNQDMSHYMEMN